MPPTGRGLGTGSADGRRTDSIILVHVPSGGGKPALISVPRDSYLPIPGHGKNKVNAAFAIGGPKLLVETLEDATGLPIDGYVEIGFGGFADVVDSLGGVDICVPRDITDAKAHINLKKGCQTLDGTTALGYVRARYSDPKGDLGPGRAAAPVPGRGDEAGRHTGHGARAVAMVGLHALGRGAACSSARTPRRSTPSASCRRCARCRPATRSSLVVPISTANATTSAGSSVLWDGSGRTPCSRCCARGRRSRRHPAGTDGTPTGG